jgi:L-iditol 2-dehydrogenase
VGSPYTHSTLDSGVKALVYTAPYRVEVQDLPPVAPGAGDVLIRVEACGICGSDVHGFRGQSRIRVPPAVLGHECSGSVAARGDGVRNVKVGGRVAIQPLLGCGQCRYCRSGRPNICPDRRLIGAHLPGGFAEYVAVPAAAVYPIPDTLSAICATLAEPLGNAIHMFGLAGERVPDSAIVIGAGTLGLLAVALLGRMKATHVISVDLDPRRLELARALGATDTFDGRDPHLAARLRDGTGGGAELMLEAVGVAESRRLAIEAAAPGALAVFLGNAEPESVLPVNDLINRELIVRGSYSCTDAELRRAIDILAAGEIDTSWVASTALDDGPVVFGKLSSGEHMPVKTVLVP